MTVSTDYDQADDDETFDAAADDDMCSPDAPSSSAFGLPATSSSVSEVKADYECLSESAIRAAMNALVDDVASVLHTDAQSASQLLRRRHWSKERVVSALISEHGAVDNATDVAVVTGPVECPICDDVVDAADAHSFSGHVFCRECAASYLRSALTVGRAAITTTCPALHCTKPVSDTDFYTLLAHADAKRYESFLVRSFVEESRRIKWCPGTSCSVAIRALSPTTRTVVCTQCATAFCFACDSEYHEPATCPQLALWKAKCASESETASWIIANTKKCPKCHVRIEKNQGCNHITCRSCAYEWCWVCNGSWSDHGNHTGGFYKCNKYDPKHKPANTSDVPTDGAGDTKSQAELNRYLFYYQRFHNHQQGALFAQRQLKTVERRTAAAYSTLNGVGDEIADVSFIASAAREVLWCRQVLANTYIYAYYIVNETERTLFEYLQHELEASTETLSEMSEAPLDKIDRERLVNYIRVTATFRKNLLSGVERGLIAGSSSNSSSMTP